MSKRAKIVGLILILLILMLPILGWKLYQKADRDLHTRNAAFDLESAIQQGNLAQVKAKLDAGIPVDIKDESGQTPLMTAAMNGKPEIVTYLLSRGAKIDLTDTLTPQERKQGQLSPGQAGGVGRTALCCAIQYDQWDTAKLLLTKGANVNIKDVNKRTALSYVMGTIANGRGTSGADKEVARLLIAKGADLNVQDDYGHTLLTWALERGDAELAMQALAHSVDINKANANGETALLLAVRADMPDVALKLIPQTDAVDAADRNGGTALLYAVNAGKADLVKALLDKGAAIDAKDTAGDTPLIGAAKEGQTEIVRLFIARHAALNLADKSGMTALGWAQARGHNAIVALLKQAGAK